MAHTRRVESWLTRIIPATCLNRDLAETGKRPSRIKSGAGLIKLRAGEEEL